MRYWSRESIRSAFYDDLKDYVTTELMRFTPLPEASPLPDYPMNVDWTLVHNNRNFYVFGVLGNDKAKTVEISLLELQKAQLPFISLGGSRRHRRDREKGTPVPDPERRHPVPGSERL